MMNFKIINNQEIILENGSKIKEYTTNLDQWHSICNLAWFQDLILPVNLSIKDIESYNISEIINLPFNAIHGQYKLLPGSFNFKFYLLTSYIILYLRTDFLIPLRESSLCIRVTSNTNMKQESFNIVEFFYPFKRNIFFEGPSSKIANLEIRNNELWII